MIHDSAVCPFPAETAHEYRPHTVFWESKAHVVNCIGAQCRICRGAAAAVSWKEVDGIVKEMFGRRKA